jgi:uncharacterized protein
MIDISPRVKQDTLIFEKYNLEQKRFIINQQAYLGNLAIINGKIIQNFELIEIISKLNNELSLIGLELPINFAKRQNIKNLMQDNSHEIMTIPAAINSFNVLVAEQRKVDIIIYFS